MPLILLLGDAANATLVETRTFEGTDNNPLESSQGAAGTPLRRVAAAQYPGDGSGEDMIRPPVRPDPRSISNAIAAQGSANAPNARGMSDFVWQWGQFLDHDIDLTRADSANGSADIPVTDPTDPLFPGPIPFSRSDYAVDTGTDDANPRQQINAISAYIDASNVYGSDTATAMTLRQFAGGRLLTSPGGLLPLDADGAFRAGDERVNEQVGLTAMHTLFVREHNRLVDVLAIEAPGADDETLYQTVRKIVGAEIQHITYTEFLPALLGPYAPDPANYAYDPILDATIANEFSAALFRFGHSMLSPELALVDEHTRDAIALRDAFFNPALFLDDPANLARVLAGLATQYAQAIDNKVVDDVRNFLFGMPGAGGLDLAALNIQRGRDHGIPDYNSLRLAYGLSPMDAFTDITTDPELAAGLELLYEDVNNVDAWVGALAEDHLPGASVGELTAAGLLDQFVRLRDGDRFFYVGDADLWSDEILAAIDLSTLTFADIVRVNTGLDWLGDDLFFVAAPAPGTLALILLGLVAISACRRDRMSMRRSQIQIISDQSTNGFRDQYENGRDFLRQ